MCSDKRRVKEFNKEFEREANSKQREFKTERAANLEQRDFQYSRELLESQNVAYWKMTDSSLRRMRLDHDKREKTAEDEQRRKATAL